jgi:hypothetical protein
MLPGTTDPAQRRGVGFWRQPPDPARIELRAELLEALEEAKRGPGSIIDTLGTGADNAHEGRVAAVFK